MGKCIFKEYNVKLHGKNYSILIPANEIREMWAEMWAGGLYHGDWDFVVLNREAFHYLRGAYLALTEDPYRIIYFPIRNIEHICRERYTQIPPDFVLYTHERQLNRKEWKKLKQCLKYIKPKQCVIRYNMPELIKEHKVMLHKWAKKKTFYRYKGWKYRDREKLFFAYETCFIETSKRLALDAAVDIQEALTRDLETELEDHQYLNYTAGALRGAISYEFGTKEFLQRREAQDWRWITEDKRTENENRLGSDKIL